MSLCQGNWQGGGGRSNIQGANKVVEGLVVLVTSCEQLGVYQLGNGESVRMWDHRWLLFSLPTKSNRQLQTFMQGLWSVNSLFVPQRGV